METNKAQKSQFVYPDKLYARCKDNNTLDMSYAPQNMEAVEYTRTDTFIEKACKFIFENYHGEKLSLKMIKDFKKYMEQ